MNPIVPEKSALLVMDLQKDVVAMFAAKMEPLLAKTAKVIEAARAKNVRIVYVVVGFRPGYPELAKDSLMASRIAGSNRFVSTTPGADIADAVKPKDGDVVVVKHRVGAFFGTDLEMVLRANGITTLVLTGVATSGVVLSTVRHASDADYRVVVVKDCCADGDDEVHRVLTEKVFTRQATVVTADAFVSETGGS
jgi:nicotinamidase-related amidase